MCGISGYVGQGDIHLLRDMADALRHRGPDGEGFWEDHNARVGFAHRRLSIVDLSEAGAQPMHSDDDRVTLCFNGELYDHAVHRDALRALGYRFRGNSDTEVLLNLYHHHGECFLDRVNGIFSLAIWDAAERSLLLVRDQMGVKPLYYRRSPGGGLVFASEIKALLKGCDVPPRICREALEAYLSFLYVPGRLTLFDGIEKLEPGTLATLRDGELQIRRWFVPDYTPKLDVPEAEWVESLAAEFDRAVERQLVADVPVGAFLSGGIDSSAIVATACRHVDSRDLRCFTICYPPDDIASEGVPSDLPYAKLVAKRLNLDLDVTEVGPEAIDSLPEIVRAVEEPDADMTAIVTHAISRSAREAGATVLLSGTGGDELFHGYRTHIAYRHFSMMPDAAHGLAGALLRTGHRLAAPLLGAASPPARRIDRYARALPLRGVERHLAIANGSGVASVADLLTEEYRRSLPNAGYLESVFARYAEVLPAGCDEATLHTWLLQQTFLADHNFLYADKCGMANSIEIRVPFMDRDLMALAAQVPAALHTAGGVTKHLLRRMLDGVLDEEVLQRPKLGFNPPIRTWIAEERSSLSRELLSDDVVRARGIFDVEAVRALRAATRAGRIDGAQLLFAIQYLELWCREFID